MLIDCAGIDGGASRIALHAFSEFECLFTGDLAVELANVGPYLGRLRSYAADVQAVALDMLEKHVAMLVVPHAADAGGAPVATFSRLHRHFRKFNVVYDPDSKPLFFRYYDPRVLANVLAVLGSEQLEGFFGPVDLFILTDPGQQIVRCQRQSGALVVSA